jgi:hypothetical protein
VSSHKAVYKILREIYNKHRRNYPENSDSDQICCMWSTNDPPDIVDDTEPINDIESAFDIVIDEDDALELYDMSLEVAAKRIIKFINRN